MPPISATPRAPPTMLHILKAPDAAPDSAGGASPTAVSLSGVEKRPMPMPWMKIAMAYHQYGVSVARNPARKRADAHDQGAGRQREPWPAAQLQPRADGDEHEHADRGRQQVQPGGEGVVAAHLLQVQREDVHGACERDVVDEVVDERAVERPAAEEAQVEQRFAHAALDEDEGREQHDGEREGGEDDGWMSSRGPGPR